MKTRNFAALLIAFLFAGLLTGCDRNAVIAIGTGAPSSSNQTTARPTSLTREEAEAAALNHANLFRDQVCMDRTEFDADDPVPHYEVEFTADGWEYDYEIHAQTGAVLKAEKEPEKGGTASFATAGTATLTREEAEAAALNHANLFRDQVCMDRTEFDADDPVPHYEVEFTADGWEYDYEIHSQTGEILKSEKEPA